MPRAICEKCGEEVNWSNTRGSKLADLTHGYVCGGKLKRPPRALDAAPRGERVTCAVCGKKRFAARGNVYRTTREHRWFGPKWNAEGTPTRPGDYVCWGHGARNLDGAYGRCAAELARTGEL